MINSAKIKLLAFITITLFCQKGFTQENPPDQGTLQFETSDKNSYWRPSFINRIGTVLDPVTGEGIITPTHAAVFNIFFRRNGWPDQEAWIKMAKDVVSEKQFEFIQQNQFITVVDQNGRGIILEYTLYAVSEEDAKKMAQLAIEILDQDALTRLDDLKKELEQERQNLSQAEQQISEMNENKKNTSEGLKQLRKITFYQDGEEAQKMVAELNNIINRIDIDIAGYEAKIKAIREKKNFDPMLDNQMLFDVEVELVGALARKNKAETIRQDTIFFVTLADKLDSLAAELKIKQEDINKTREEIKSKENLLTQMPPGFRPVEVIDNKVVISPVKPVQ